MLIIYLKRQHEEVNKTNEISTNHLQDWEAYYGILEVELASLRCELEKNKQLVILVLKVGEENRNFGRDPHQSNISSNQD